MKYDYGDYQKPGESHRSTRLLQLTGRWQNDGIISLALRSVKSNNTFKYHVFAPMGRFQLEIIYLYFSPSFHITVGSFCPVGFSLL